jgi:hypothetical protein
MRRLLIVVGVLATLGGQLFAQDNSWKPLGGWQLIERLDDVQIVQVLRKGDLVPAIFLPKPTWQPEGGDFFPASDVLLYRRMPASTGQQEYYAYESYNIVLDDANIRARVRSCRRGAVPYQQRRNNGLFPCRWILHHSGLLDWL